MGQEGSRPGEGALTSRGKIRWSGAFARNPEAGERGGRLWAAEGRHGGGTPPALRVARLRHRVAQLTKVWPPGVPLMQKSAEFCGKMQTKA